MSRGIIGPFLHMRLTLDGLPLQRPRHCDSDDAPRLLLLLGPEGPAAAAHELQGQAGRHVPGEGRLGSIAYIPKGQALSLEGNGLGAPSSTLVCIRLLLCVTLQTTVAGANKENTNMIDRCRSTVHVRSTGGTRAVRVYGC